MSDSMRPKSSDPDDVPSPVRARAERTALKAELPALLSAKESLLLQMARIANMAPDGRTTWTAGALEEIAVLLHIAADTIAAHDAERQELREQLETLRADTTWECKARPTADPSQDCDWPSCGCDPHALQVIAALEESGAFEHIGGCLRNQPTTEHERCAEHPATTLDLVCATCFESDRTAAANERAEHAEAATARLREALESVEAHFVRTDEDDYRRIWCTGCDAPFTRGDAALQHKDNCVWRIVDAALAPAAPEAAAPVQHSATCALMTTVRLRELDRIPACTCGALVETSAPVQPEKEGR